MRNIQRHLEACIHTEQYTAEVYSALGQAFPRWKKLFFKLARAEEKHANILTLAIGLRRFISPGAHGGGLPASTKASMEILDRLAAMVYAPDISLGEDILPELMRLEASSAEGYMDEIMRGRGGGGLLNYLRQFHDDERSHLEMLRDLEDKLDSAV